jgi:hypothetical protein
MLGQLQAFMLEALRWRLVAPIGMSFVVTFPDMKRRRGSMYARMLGFAHRTTKDIVWVCSSPGLCRS